MASTSGPRRWFTWPHVTIGAAVITAVATVSVPFVTAYFNGGDPPPLPKCAFPAVGISAPDQVGSTFETTTKLLCAPPKGMKYYFISQEDNVGEKGTEHPVYCPKEGIVPGAEKKSYTVEREVYRSPIGSKRSVYYLRVDAAQEQELLANLVDTCAWKLPLGVEKVSNTVEIERGWK